MVFVNRIAEAEELSSVLGNELHAPVPHVTSVMSRGGREAIKKQIIDGSIKLVVATPVWSTGINIPNLKSVVLAGRGKSAIRLKQMAGRATRKHKGKSGYTIYDLHAFDDNGIQRLGILADAGFDVPASAVAAPVDLGSGVTVSVNSPPVIKVTQAMIDRERNSVLILIGMLFALIAALAFVSELAKGCTAG